MPSSEMKPTFHPFQTGDPRLRPIHEKVLADQSLDRGDVVALLASHDILALGWLANQVREHRHGPRTAFTVHTFVTGPADEYIVAGDDFSRVLIGVENLRKEHARAHIAAYTVEQLAADPARARDLRQAGADSLIGDGAEVFHPAIRKILWRPAVSLVQRTAAHDAARAAGLQAPLYLMQRHQSPEKAADEIISLRKHDAENFASFSFPPDVSTSPHLAVTTGMQEMKYIAVARLALGNISHIRAYAQMLGPKLVQLALRFGASELDGTPLEQGAEEALKRELAREITVAGREPRELPSLRRALVIL